jgi:hypothetical protein
MLLRGIFCLTPFLQTLLLLLFRHCGIRTAGETHNTKPIEEVNIKKKKHTKTRPLAEHKNKKLQLKHRNRLDMPSMWEHIHNSRLSQLIPQTLNQYLRITR